PSLVSWALYTTPMPPPPSFSMILYCPSVSPIMAGSESYPCRTDGVKDCFLTCRFLTPKPAIVREDTCQGCAESWSRNAPLPTPPGVFPAHRFPHPEKIGTPRACRESAGFRFSSG